MIAIASAGKEQKILRHAIAAKNDADMEILKSDIIRNALRTNVSKLEHPDQSLHHYAELNSARIPHGGQTSTASCTQTEYDAITHQELRSGVQMLYKRYTEATERKKWNGLNAKIAKPSDMQAKKKRTPSPILELMKQTKSNAIDQRTLAEKLSGARVISYLWSPEERSITIPKRVIDSKAVNQAFLDTQSCRIDTKPDQESQCTNPFKQSLDQMNSMHQVQHLPSASQTPSADCQPDKQNRPRKRQLDKSNPNWYLEYLGLNSISDLFSSGDDDSDNEPVPTNTVKQSNNPTVQLNNNPGEFSRFNESVPGGKSQFTVPEILKICADAERESNAHDGISSQGTTNCHAFQNHT